MRILPLAILVLTVGCATPRTSIDIGVTPDGTVSIGHEPIALAQLPKALKSRGATHATGIYVSVPDQVSPAVMRQLSETLATAGYARVMFIKPKKALSETKP